MRSALLSLSILVLAACSTSRTADGVFGGDGAVGEPTSACRIDDDCVPAAASCCACPTYAVNRDDPTQAACGDVACPPVPAGAMCPETVRAACEGGQCVLACQAVACDVACDVGFDVDAAGCLSCACAGPQDGGCVADTDCVETRAACCGCAEGGADTAVLAGDQAAFDASLGCGSSPTCPQVNVCEPGAAPACVGGHCELATPDRGGLPPGACGRSDLPPCPSGTVCTVNVNSQATAQGVGVCVQP